MTIFGKFEDNELIDINTGEILFCITYKSVREKINGKTGFFNIKYDTYDNPIIYQYVLLDEIN